MASPAHFQVDPRLAVLLGETYRSTEQALKELVDNAWDADAENVWIELPEPMTDGVITIKDDGAGMTEKELRSDYLKVANDRRSRKGEHTIVKKRKVKGRKGIGKFAGLIAADAMRIETQARGTATSVTINKNALLDTDMDLERIDLDLKTSQCKEDQNGTHITLSSLVQTLNFPTAEKLKQLLILEYGRETDFNILVNNQPLRVEDIPGQNVTEQTKLPEAGAAKLNFSIAEGKQSLKQSGIVVRVDGKTVGKPHYFGLEEAEDIPPKLLKKVWGEVEVDGLADYVTGDGGAILENSKAYQHVEHWVQQRLRTHVEDTFKREVALARARLQQKINKRLERLPEHRREFAQRAMERIMQRFYGESEERIEPIASVVLDAMERDEYWQVLNNINESKHSEVAVFADALESFGLLELGMMAQQTQRRIEFLDNLDLLVANPDTLEKDVHKAIENSLWVLGMEYSLMTSNKTLSRIVNDYLDKQYTGDNASKRPDLLLANDHLNRYLLIEFKRPSHSIDRDDENQAIKYRDDLAVNFGDAKAIDILIVGGKRADIPSQYDRPDVKRLTFSELISRARSELDWLLKNLS